MRSVEQSLEAAETSLAPRKMPQQKRARMTVECILQATEELVRAHGFSQVGTRMIAERAGVSVGSLYQYFPTYESILLTWYERVALSGARRMKLTTVDVLDRDLSASIRISIRALLRVYEQQALALIHMPSEVPAIRRATASTSFECLNRSAMRLFFSQHVEFKPRDVEAHIFFLESIIFHTLQRYLLDKPRYLKRGMVVEQICRIVECYLREHRTG